jgi:dihydrofolate synthase/folylpolyglutamate synthase
LEDLVAGAAKLDVPVVAAKDLEDALRIAQEVTPKDGVIVATGSVFLVGEIRGLVK